MGISVKNNKETDQRRTDYERSQQRALRTQRQDDDDDASGANKGLVKKGDGTRFYTAAKTKGYKERQAKKKACKEAEAAGTVVGAGGADADAVTNKDKDEAIQKNLDEQSKTEGGSV